MDSAGDIGFVGLAVSLVLVVVAFAISLRLRLRLERDLVVSVARGLVQLLIVGAALAIIIDPDTPLVWSWLWVVGIVVFAAATVKRRAPAVPGLFWIALVANGVTGAHRLRRRVRPRDLPGPRHDARADRRDADRQLDEVGDRRRRAARRGALRAARRGRGAAGARSALDGGLAADPARALRTALSPQIENTKALGIVFLPGAMTGLILAGVDPLDAVLVQLALMYLILGGVATTAAVTALGAVRRLFTSDHRLVALPRSTRDADRLECGVRGARSSEDDGALAVAHDAVLAVPLHGAGEHGALDVGAAALELLGAVVVRDADDVLLDDRALVELLGGVVRGRADELHAAVVGARVRPGAGEGGQERVVDVDDRHARPPSRKSADRICM